MSNLLRKTGVPLLLICVLVAGGALRLYNLDWDQGHYFHPDERMILMTVDKLYLPWPLDWEWLVTPESPLNPHFFAYGSLPLYLLKGVAHLLALIQPGWADIMHTRLVGRGISGLFDTGLILLVFLLGKRLYDRRVGLLAAVFVAFTVLHIQLSHFYAVDTILTFFIVSAMLCAVEVMQHGSLRASLGMGLCLGLALATKVSVAPFALTVAIAWVLWGVSASANRRIGKSTSRNLFASFPWSRVGLGVALAGLLALVVFIVGEPYAVLDWENFAARLMAESAMVQGLANAPYTYQYINTPPYLYQVWNTTVWGMGIPLGLVAFGGLIWSVIKGVLRRRQAELLILSWVLVYFGITGGFMVKFLRYMLPLAPFLCILGAAMLVDWQDWLASRKSAIRKLPSALIVVVLLPTIFYAVAFMSVYAETHPWIQISEWIYHYLPANAVIATEHWDDKLPLDMPVPGDYFPGASYRYLTMRNYHEDTRFKLNWMIDNIVEANVIILASNRLYGSIPRLPERYPLTRAYYELLFGEKLGYQLAGVSATYPNLWGVTLVDDTLSDPQLPTPLLLTEFRPSPIVLNLGHADESFTVYDHPKPLVFLKTRQLAKEELRTLFASLVPLEDLPEGSPPAPGYDY